jgi:hypothetical protein
VIAAILRREKCTVGSGHPRSAPETSLMVFQCWHPGIAAKQVSEPKPQVNSGKIPNANFTKREIAFVLLVI